MAEQVADGAHDLSTALAELGSDDGVIRHGARIQLVTAGEPAVTTLIACLSASRLNARWEAAKALTEVLDVRAIPALIVALTDDGPGVRWLAAEALANLGRVVVEPILYELIRNSGSNWFREGAHHVLRELSKGDLRDVVQPVILALEGMAPDVAVLAPAHEVLTRLDPSGRRRPA